MTRTDEEILKIAREHNVGDLNLGYTMKTRDWAGRLVNRDALRNNVLPEMVVNRNHPEENYVFVWCPLDDSEYARKYVNDSKRDGYEPVTEHDWIINEDAWSWHKPEKWKFRWSVTKLLINEDYEFLMFRDEAKWQKQQDERGRFNEDRIEARQEASIDQAARIAHDKGLGVEIAATQGGRERSVKPSTRVTIS